MSSLRSYYINGFKPIKGGYRAMRTLKTNFGVRRANANRIGNMVINRRINRRRRKERKNGVELNRADGGYKSILTRKKITNLAVNQYLYLKAIKDSSATDNGMVYAFENANNTLFEIQLNTLLAQSEEFRNYLNISEQYKVYSINVSIDYNRTPTAGDIMPKLLLYYNTANVDTKNPLTANNVMTLNMFNTGTKNYNVHINRNNIDRDYVGWLNTSKSYNTKINLICGNISHCYINGNPDYIRLGNVKVTFNVKFRLRDQNYDVISSQTIQQKMGMIPNFKIEKKTEKKKPKMVDASTQTIDKKIKSPGCNSLIIKSNGEIEGEKSLQNKFKKQVENHNALKRALTEFGLGKNEMKLLINIEDYNLTVKQVKLLVNMVMKIGNKYRNDWSEKNLLSLQVIIGCLESLSCKKEIKHYINLLKDYYETVKNALNHTKRCFLKEYPEDMRIFSKKEYTKEDFYKDKLKDAKDTNKKILHAKQMESLSKSWAVSAREAAITESAINRDNRRNDIDWYKAKKQEERLMREENEKKGRLKETLEEIGKRREQEKIEEYEDRYGSDGEKIYEQEKIDEMIWENDPYL